AGKGRLIVPKRVGSFVLCPLLVGLEEAVDGRKSQLWSWHPKLIVDDIVEALAELTSKRGILQPNHGSAEQGRLEAGFMCSSDHSDRVKRIGGDKDRVRSAGFDGPNNWSEIGRCGRIGPVIDDAKPNALGLGAGTPQNAGRSLGIEANQSHGLDLR